MVVLAKGVHLREEKAGVRKEDCTRRRIALPRGSGRPPLHSPIPAFLTPIPAFLTQYGVGIPS